MFSRKIKFVLPLIHVMLSVIKPHTHLYGVTFAYPVKNILHFDENLAWPSNYPKHSLLSTLQVWHFGSDLMIFDGLFGKILEFSHSLCVKLLILSVWPSLKASKGLKISKVFGCAIVLMLHNDKLVTIIKCQKVSKNAKCHSFFWFILSWNLETLYRISDIWRHMCFMQRKLCWCARYF